MDYRNELLSKSPQSEKRVCKILDELGIRYIRQYPIHTPRKNFYADIYVPSLRLIIEVDGKYHFTDKQKRLDNNRSACLRRMGFSIYRVINLPNYTLQKAVVAVIKRRKNALNTQNCN